jgi:dolichyl-phosphate-mannose-protein mannosyltransferase
MYIFIDLLRFYYIGYTYSMKDKKNLPAIAVLTIVAALTRLIHFGVPAQVVFDETYFLKFVGQYWTGTYFFDVHPPLGKLLFVFFASLIGVTPSADIGTIGTAIDPSLVLLRLLPILAGIALPLIVYAICRNLRLSYVSSFAAGIFICLENSLILQSRIVLTDMILIVFGFASLLLYLIYRNRTPLPHASVYLWASAITYACTISTKWTGLFFIIPIVAFELYDLFHKTRTWHTRVLRFISHAVLYAAVSIVIYTSLFAIHFALLPLSGPGDAFMSERFQKTLMGSKTAHNSTLSEPQFFEKFFELNLEMYSAHTRMTSEHTYASKYYTWPLMIRPIYYWYQSGGTTPQTDSRMYLIGNPALYWGGTAAILALIVYFFVTLETRKLRTTPNKPAFYFIVIGFLANFLPFIFIGRIMFLYHYAAALVFSIMAIAYLLDLIPETKRRIRLTILCIILVTLVFYYFSPLTYGRALTPGEYESHVWFSTWK